MFHVIFVHQTCKARCFYWGVVPHGIFIQTPMLYGIMFSNLHGDGNISGTPTHSHMATAKAAVGV